MPSESATTTWWWVRHAPVLPPHDVGFAPPDAEADVSDGAAVAAAAGRLPDDAIWIASPMQRTRTTCAALLQARGGVDAAPLLERAFAEQDFGDWHGRSYRDVYRDLSADDMAAPALVQPPGGERFAQVVPRVSAGIAQYNDRFAGRDIVAVAHAGTIRAALAEALDLEPRQAIGFVIDLLSLTRIGHHVQHETGRSWSVQAVNIVGA